MKDPGDSVSPLQKTRLTVEIKDFMARKRRVSSLIIVEIGMAHEVVALVFANEAEDLVEWEPASLQTVVLVLIYSVIIPIVVEKVVGPGAMEIFIIEIWLLIKRPQETMSVVLIALSQSGMEVTEKVAGVPIEEGGGVTAPTPDESKNDLEIIISAIWRTENETYNHSSHCLLLNILLVIYWRYQNKGASMILRPYGKT